MHSSMRLVQRGRLRAILKLKLFMKKCFWEFSHTWQVKLGLDICTALKKDVFFYMLTFEMDVNCLKSFGYNIL